MPDAGTRHKHQKIRHTVHSTRKPKGERWAYTKLYSLKIGRWRNSYWETFIQKCTIPDDACKVRGSMFEAKIHGQSWCMVGANWLSLLLMCNTTMMNVDHQTSNNMMRDGRLGLFLRVAPSTPGKERRRKVVKCGSLEELSIKIEEESLKRQLKLSKSASFSSSHAPVTPNLLNRWEESPKSISRRPSMKRSNDSLERWSDSIGSVGTELKKSDSSPSFPSRSGKTAVDTDSSPRNGKPCVPCLKALENAIGGKGNALTRQKYRICKKSGPPINIDCAQPCEGCQDLEDEDLTEFTLDSNCADGF